MPSLRQCSCPLKRAPSWRLWTPSCWRLCWQRLERCRGCPCCAERAARPGRRLPPPSRHHLPRWTRANQWSCVGASSSARHLRATIIAARTVRFAHRLSLAAVHRCAAGALDDSRSSEPAVESWALTCLRAVRLPLGGGARFLATPEMLPRDVGLASDAPTTLLRGDMPAAPRSKRADHRPSLALSAAAAGEIRLEGAATFAHLFSGCCKLSVLCLSSLSVLGGLQGVQEAKAGLVGGRCPLGGRDAERRWAVS